MRKLILLELLVVVAVMASLFSFYTYHWTIEGVAFGFVLAVMGSIVILFLCLILGFIALGIHHIIKEISKMFGIGYWPAFISIWLTIGGIIMVFVMRPLIVGG